MDPLIFFAEYVLMMLSLIDEYIENIAKMKLSPDDYGDKKKVKKHNSMRN